jgi:hypothetical protein
VIKIKLLNCKKGRNSDTFESLKSIHWRLFNDFGVELLWHNNDWNEEFNKKADTSDYDYLIIGPADFVDKGKSLNDSVNWGLENLNKVSENGDYFLWDGFDSTSLLGSYDVFEQSNAIYLLKNQLLNNREDYNKPYNCGKWFFGESESGVSYNISEEKWKNIKLSGINLGYTYMAKMFCWNVKHKEISACPFDYHDLSCFEINKEKNIDVLSVYLTEIGESFEHNFRNDLSYMNHRKKAWDIVNDLNYKTFISDKIEKKEYFNKIYDSKIMISPFGQGEICYRDWEAIQLGTLMIKPDMSRINTTPNMYVDNETYISCNYDWSDLKEKIDYALSNFNELNEKIVHNLRLKCSEEYNSHNVCNYWYNMIKNLPSVVEEN